MIGVLIFPDFQLLDAAGPISAFEIAARVSGDMPAIRVMAMTPGPVKSSSGVEMLARGTRPAGALSTLVVSGGQGVDRAARCARTLAFVRGVARRGVRVASVCSGAIILAEAGLLDGKRATTHWQRTRHFLSAYPKVKLEPDRIFVRDGDIWTSAGITAGIDMSLALISEDFGEEIAQKTARQLVLYHRRAGGQSQFSSLLELKAPTGRFARLGARTSRHAAHGGRHGRAGRHERAAFHPRFCRRNRHHAVQGGGAAARRSGKAARAIVKRSDRARRRDHGFPRS
jgi:transcriptional regulator GlxA family with amidase domain